MSGVCQAVLTLERPIRSFVSCEKRLNPIQRTRFIFRPSVTRDIALSAAALRTVRSSALRSSALKRRTRYRRDYQRSDAPRKYVRVHRFRGARGGHEATPESTEHVPPSTHGVAGQCVRRRVMRSNFPSGRSFRETFHALGHTGPRLQKRHLHPRYQWL